ncbi:MULTISPECIES: hypothetical protein [unclassified Moorena]|uniref:hypothetical protein n=1 Tax=unclassified Moorena TaxID=2683338 RepID=UPI0025F20D74|nr:MULTISPECIES: hypothetical protein [unclassified Moorena]
MELQDYLRTQGLESLCNQFKIKVNRHQQFPDLVCLKYSQIESPLEEKIVQQCRGIILDEANNWEIISYPYDNFFNYGESQAATLDWKNTRGKHSGVEIDKVTPLTSKAESETIRENAA